MMTSELMAARGVLQRRTELLKAIAAQLRQWAVETRRGGWSTHQVDPMRRLADQIDEETR